jgi:hypothetical protein
MLKRLTSTNYTSSWKAASGLRDIPAMAAEMKSFKMQHV